MSNTLAAIEKQIGPGKETDPGDESMRQRDYKCGCSATTVNDNPQWNVFPCATHIGAKWL
jgi:hypothetical protein